MKSSMTQNVTQRDDYKPFEIPNDSYWDDL